MHPILSKCIEPTAGSKYHDHFKLIGGKKLFAAESAYDKNTKATVYGKINRKKDLLFRTEFPYIHYRQRGIAKLI